MNWQTRKYIFQEFKYFFSIRVLHTVRQLRYSQQTFVGLEDVFKTSSRHVLKTSSTRLQRNNFASSKTSWRRLEDLLEDVKLLRWRHLEDVLKACLEDLKTCLEDVLKTCLEDILETSKILTGNICILIWG